jgi:hypothetical protein
MVAFVVIFWVIVRVGDWKDDFGDSDDDEVL